MIVCTYLAPFPSILAPNLLLFSIKTAAPTSELRLSNNNAPMICWTYCNICFLNVQSNNSSHICLHSTLKRGVEGVLANVDYNNFNLISLIYNHWLLAKSTIPPWNKLNWHLQLTFSLQIYNQITITFLLNLQST